VDISRKKYPFDFQIQEVFNGLDAEKIFEGKQSDYDKYSFSLGEIIAKLSMIEIKGYGHFKPELFKEKILEGENNNFYDYINLQLVEQVQKIEKEKLITSKVTKEILTLFENAKTLMNDSKSSLIHYDLADHNLRYDKNTFKTVAVYDWEACVAGDSILDLASSPSWKPLYPRKEKIKEGFLSLAPQITNLQEKIDLYFLRTIIWKVEHNIKFNIVTPARLKRLSVALEPFKLKMKA